MSSAELAKSIFLAVVELPAPERGAHLDKACRDDADLRRRVEELLLAHEGTDSLLDPHAPQTVTFQPPADSETADLAGRNEIPGAILANRYKLVELIGEGGMGTIWLANQSEPVKRTVAVKVIKAGMDSKQVLNRFEAERQALAMMDHPNIAKVLDGGLTADSRPFFVMELVKGISITEYCDARKLTPKERLELFVPVCNAIQHAHQKGIIHRDIKPSNVLIALYDDKPVPKVIDFGVAKATGRQLSEQTINTGFGGVVGTPQYMSPEQATLNNLDIDTRSDVYSLGVLLYELLTGSPPFSTKGLKKAGLMEILRVVREEEPPRPSTKLSTADALPSLSANRNTEPKKLTGLLRNELDWIVMRALEKDRRRRYETANDFATDVNRYLAGEAVQAHPPSVGYRLRKFMRRHRGEVIAGLAVLTAVMAGAGVAVWQALAARAAERDAVAASGREFEQRLEAEKKEIAAKDAEAATKEVLRFISDKVFAAARPIGREGGLGKDVKLRQALDAAEKSISTTFVNRPHVELEIRDVLGNTYEHLAEYDERNRQNDLWLEVCEQKLNRIHPDYGSHLKQWWYILETYHSSKLESAEKRLEAAYLHYLQVFGPDDPGTLRMAMLHAAGLASIRGMQAEAQQVASDSLNRVKRIAGLERKAVFGAERQYAEILCRTGQAETGIRQLEATLAQMRNELPPDDDDILGTLALLGTTYQKHARRYDDAIRCYTEGKLLQKKKPETPYREASDWDYGLAVAYSEAGRDLEAVPIWEAKMPQLIERLGHGHQNSLGSAINLTHSYNRLKRFEDTIRVTPPYLEAGIRHYGADFRTMRILRTNFIFALLCLQRPEAESQLNELCQSAIRDLETGHEPFDIVLADLREFRVTLKLAQTELVLKQLLDALAQAMMQPKWCKSRSEKNWGLRVNLLTELVKAFVAAGKFELAKPLIDQLIADARATHPAGSLKLAQELQAYAKLLIDVRDFSGSDRLHREALAIFEQLELRTLGVAVCRYNHSQALFNLKRYEEAEKEARASLEWLRTAGKKYESLVNLVNSQLFAYYHEWNDGKGDPDRMEALLNELATQARQNHGPESLEYASQLSRSVLHLLRLKRWTSAEVAARTCLAIREKSQPEVWNTFNTKSMLGGALMGQQKYAETGPLLLQGYEGMKRREADIPPDGRDRLPESVNRLIEYYRATNMPGEVKKWLAEREKYPAPVEKAPPPREVK